MTIRRIAAAWAIGCAVASTLWCVTAASRLGVTFDEPVYVTAGLDRWRHGGTGGLMRLGTMPLAVDVVTLPIRIAERWRGEPYRLASDGRGRVADARDLGEVLPIARAGTLAFWWLLLLSAWRLAARAAGAVAAAVAVTWVAAEPSLLAHASLATTDIAATALLLAFAGSLPETDHAWRTRWVGPSLWFALAILAKASAIVFAPVIAIAFAIAGGGRSGPRTRGEWTAVVRSLLRMGALALAIVFVYCGSDWRTEPSFVEWSRSLSPGPLASTSTAIAERLPIFSNAGEGLAQQIKHNVRGHGTFVLGQAYPRAVWFYFPVVLVLKTSAAMQTGLVAVALVAGRALLNRLAAAALMLIALSPAFRVQTGVRMVLPIVALLIVAVAAAAGAAFALPARRRAAAAVAVLITMGTLTTAVRAWPDGLVFVNELWGGSEPYRLVSDSNFDWGQGLPRLRRALASEERPVLLWYWGSDPAALTGPWQLLDVRRVTTADDAAIRAAFAGRTVVVSTTLMFGSVLVDRVPVDVEDRAALERAIAIRRVLEEQGVSERIGTYLVYRL
jgi:hypothetical protein